MQPEELSCSEPIVETEVLRQETCPQAPGWVSKPLPKQLTFSGSGRDQPEQHFYGSGLARSVRTKESENLTAFDRQAEISNSNLIAEQLAQAVDFDRG